MKSLMLMDENITLKLQMSSQKEDEHSNLIKSLMEEKTSKSENDEILKLIKELKINNDTLMSKLQNIERRVEALESITSTPIKKEEDISIERFKVIHHF